MSTGSDKQRDEVGSDILYTRESLRRLDAIKDRIGEAILKRATDLAKDGGRDLVTIQEVDAATDDFFWAIQSGQDAR